MIRPGARVPFADRRIVLGVSGGIAAFKAITVARELTLAGSVVDVVLTSGAADFVRPLSFEALTGRPVLSAPWRAGDPLRHIRLARDAELVLVAPATANLLARAAAGMADDLLTAVLLATEAPVVLCPAMNDRMYVHPQMQANLARLREIGYRIAGPTVGPLAWGEGEGKGRMIEPEEILAYAGRALDERESFADRRVLVTAGPTREAIDPVRFIGNRSSGRMGYAITAAAWRRGAEVVLVSGPSSLAPPVGVEMIRVESAEEMCNAVAERLPSAELLIMAAAVADYRPVESAPVKIKKASAEAPTLQLERTPDILRTTRDLRSPGCVAVGFALETGQALEQGRRKLEEKELDLVVVNDALEPGAGFEVETNRVTLLHRAGGEYRLPLLPKTQVADRILDAVEPLLSTARA